MITVMIVNASVFFWNNSAYINLRHWFRILWNFLNRKFWTHPMLQLIFVWLKKCLITNYESITLRVIALNLCLKPLNFNFLCSIWVHFGCSQSLIKLLLPYAFLLVNGSESFYWHLLVKFNFELVASVFQIKSDLGFQCNIWGCPFFFLFFYSFPRMSEASTTPISIF